MKELTQAEADRLADMDKPLRVHDRGMPRERIGLTFFDTAVDKRTGWRNPSVSEKGASFFRYPDVTMHDGLTDMVLVGLLGGHDTIGFFRSAKVESFDASVDWSKAKVRFFVDGQCVDEQPVNADGSVQAGETAVFSPDSSFYVDLDLADAELPLLEHLRLSVDVAVSRLDFGRP